MKLETAKRLYEYRKASGFSQEQVAAKIGVSRQAVSKWECAESSPDTDNLIALAVLYDVTVDELLFADPEEMTVRAARAQERAAEPHSAENPAGETAVPAADASGAGNTAPDPQDSTVQDQTAPHPKVAEGRPFVSSDSREGAGVPGNMPYTRTYDDEGAPHGYDGEGSPRGYDGEGGPRGYNDDSYDDGAEAFASSDAFAEESTWQRPNNPDDDYVDVSFTRGVHVRDSKKGEEVHVGWDGIHVDSDKEHVHLDFGFLARMIREFRKDQR